MNSFDVIGWLVEDTYYCLACAPTNREDDGAHPIFADSETDSFSHCALCEALIPEKLTGEGVDRHMRDLRDYLVDRHGRPEILAQWAEQLSNYFSPSEESEICKLVLEACDEQHLKVAINHMSVKYRNALLAIQGTAGAVLQEE